jgi:hypothetical protein
VVVEAALIQAQALVEAPAVAAVALTQELQQAARQLQGKVLPEQQVFPVD